MPVEIIALIIVLAIAFGVVLPVGIIVFLKRLQTDRAAAAHAQFPNTQIIVPGANFFGQESRKGTQMRGNGTLVITDSEVYFERWLPRAEYRIPRSAIESLETPSWYLGKSVFRPLLKINFRRDDGTHDSMAWFVPDIQKVKQILERG